jgi:hypothetical protein
MFWWLIAVCSWEGEKGRIPGKDCAGTSHFLHTHLCFLLEIDNLSYKYLGILIYSINFTFKVVPHITNAIQDWIERVAAVPVDGKEGPADVCVIELGGTIGG